MLGVEVTVIDESTVSNSVTVIGTISVIVIITVMVAGRGAVTATVTVTVAVTDTVTATATVTVAVAVAVTATVTASATGRWDSFRGIVPADRRCCECVLAEGPFLKCTRNVTLILHF